MRTNAAVVDAWLRLIDEGDLRPGAKRIAERAGVSLRSVFHHFEDLESLYATAAERQLRRFFSGPPLPVEGTLAERIERFVAARSRQLEAVTPMRRAAVLNEPFSPPLAARLKWARQRARAEIERVFSAELTALKPVPRHEILSALTVTAEWSTWEAMRAHQGLSAAQARRVMKRAIASLLREA